MFFGPAIISITNMSTPSKYIYSWQRLFTFTILTIYFYVFMEWLFFATKPSFMDAMPFEKKLEVFLLTGLALAILIIPCLVVFRLLGLIPGPTRRWQVFQIIGVILPAILTAAITILLIDNFTYTLFKFGIITSRGITRGLYGLLGVILLAAWYRQMLFSIKCRVSPTLSGKASASRYQPTVWHKIQMWSGIVLIAVSLGLGLVRVAGVGKPTTKTSRLIERQPNIVLLGGDGVVASRMSLYGYARDTTPNLREMAKTGLLAENNFTNGDHTTSSVISILTGKYPAKTRVMFSPNILQGEDAYQHLPGILQYAGYTTVEITFPYYIDAYDLNMQDGFDEVNGRSIGQGAIFQLAREFHLEDAGYFLPSLFERISDRLLHIFYIRNMPDPYRQVIQAVDPNTIPTISDRNRILDLISLLVTSERPVFVHVHLMDTHGGMFHPRKNVFSAGETQSREWMTDFYDDAVLDFDAYIGELQRALSRNGLVDNTIIIVYSDHADQWRENDRIPLLFRFPNGEFAGRTRNNTQNLDIAPTLLDYLGMEIPGWMSGVSLLRSEPASTRPIISAGTVPVDCNRPGWWCIIDPRFAKPPFYQFGYFQAVVCQKMYKLDLVSKVFSESEVRGHTAPCNTAELPTSAEVRAILLEHLRVNGFDISSLLK